MCPGLTATRPEWRPEPAAETDEPGGIGGSRSQRMRDRRIAYGVVPGRAFRECSGLAMTAFLNRVAGDVG